MQGKESERSNTGRRSRKGTFSGSEGDPNKIFGSVIDAEKERYTNDAIFRETPDRAMNALKSCSLTFFPKEKYKLWEDMELTFDPKPEP